MIDKKTIEEMKNKLVEVYDPLEIYLFGSYAWGNPTEDSDLDFFIVVDKAEKNRHKMLVDGHRALWNFDVAKDIIVYTKDEFTDRVNDLTTLVYKIKREGRVVYAKA